MPSAEASAGEGGSDRPRHHRRRAARGVAVVAIHTGGGRCHPPWYPSTVIPAYPNGMTSSWFRAELEASRALEVAVRPDLRRDLERAAELEERKLSPNTRRAYASDWAQWVKWANAAGVPSTLPIAVPLVRAWLAYQERKGLAAATIRRRANALTFEHENAGYPTPVKDDAIRELLAGVANDQADQGRTSAAKRPLTTSMVRSVVDELDTLGRAIVLVGLVSGLRRDELAALLWRDVEKTNAGVRLWVRRGKTDQAGRGTPVGVPRGKGSTCPVRALAALRAEAYSNGGGRGIDRVFGVTGRTIARRVKAAVAKAREDPTEYGAHSLRAGMMTTAAEAKVDLATAAIHGRWRSLEVAAGYVRPVDADRNPAALAVVDALADD